MNGYQGNIEKLTLGNTDFRRVLYTGQHAQLVLMNLRPGEDIGEEVHEDVDQFFRFEQGEGEVIIDGTSHGVGDGDAVIVPASSAHNVVNKGEGDLKLYTLYSPPNHADGTIHVTKAEAEADDEHYRGRTTE